MSNTASRFGGGFLALAVIWVGVYWLWEPTRTAGVSFASDSPRVEEHSRDHPPALSTEVPLDSKNEDELPSEQPLAVVGPISTAEETKPVASPLYENYTIRRGDTFERISKRFYGTVHHADALSKANPFVSPTRLREGEVIRVPVDPKNVQGRPTEDNEADVQKPEFIEYVVVKGDTLSEIAQRFYGSLRYAEVIYNANRETMQSMDDLSIGETLRIPSRMSVLGKDDD